MAQLTASQERELRDAIWTIRFWYDCKKKKRIHIDWFVLIFRSFWSDIENRIEESSSCFEYKANDNELQQLLTQMDTDNSGEIDFDELRSLWAHHFLRNILKKNYRLHSKNWCWWKWIYHKQWTRIISYRVWEDIWVVKISKRWLNRWIPVEMEKFLRWILQTIRLMTFSFMTEEHSLYFNMVSYTRIITT